MGEFTLPKYGIFYVDEFEELRATYCDSMEEFRIAKRRIVQFGGTILRCVQRGE